MSSKGTKLTLKKNKKLDCLVHPETGLVFKSATEKVVTGRVVNDELVDLDEEALQLCEEHGFKVDPELISDEGTAEENEEEPVEVKKEEPKKSVSVEEAVKKPVVKKPVEKPVEKSSEKIVAALPAFAAILQRHTKELQDFVDGKQTETQAATERVSSLEEQLKQVRSELADRVSSLTKELEETKKKLKGVLAAMQGDL